MRGIVHDVEKLQKGRRRLTSWKSVVIGDFERVLMLGKILVNFDDVIQTGQ